MSFQHNVPGFIITSKHNLPYAVSLYVSVHALLFLTRNPLCYIFIALIKSCVFRRYNMLSLLHPYIVLLFWSRSIFCTSSHVRSSAPYIVMLILSRSIVCTLYSVAPLVTFDLLLLLSRSIFCSSCHVRSSAPCVTFDLLLLLSRSIFCSSCHV